MTMLQGTTSLVALILLGCLVWTEAEAQNWRNSGQSISNFASLHPRSGNSRQTPRDPKVTIPQKPYQSNLQGTQLHYETKQTPEQTSLRCEVPGNQRIPCGAPDISAERCDAISCCFDGRQCYFSKAVTVHCTKDGHFIVVVAIDATVPNINLESISLLRPDEGCGCVESNSAFAIYYFPVTGCGTVVTEESGFLIYQNQMSSSYEVGVGPFGLITRDSKYELSFQCRYSATSVEALVVELGLQDPPESVAAEGPVRVQLKLGNGRCTEKGCNEAQAAYTSFYTTADYPVTKVLREPVYVEVELMEKTDPLNILTLDHCWATARPYPHSLPQWDILINGCPSRVDPFLSQLIPIPYPSDLEMPEHHKRFMFKMFSFVENDGMEPTNQQVYIHCSTSVCLAIPGQFCIPSCPRMKREVQDAVNGMSRPKGVTSVGPLILGKGKV